ncbi:TonB-dependent receptor [Thalassotalea sp. 42_200_T64]|nr:TonB-dependent receptor [Thalassotalea sp. 42_200_T64]
MSTKTLIALAISSALSLPVSAFADDSENVIEEVTVVAKKLSHANHVIAPSMVKQQSSVSSVLAIMDNLPGISINEGDAFGGDDWSTSITMRGFTIDGNQQQLGMTIDGIPNGGSNYGGGAKANRYLDSENMGTIEVSQGTSDISSASLEALGGTFNFVSADPAFEETTKIAYTNGDHDASRYFIRHDTGRIFENTYAYMSYSSTSTSRWVGKGSNGGMQREHAELKFISELGNLSITGRLSYDDADEDNYNSVSIEQFNQTPDWDQLTWNWTGTPHFDQMFAEGWSTLRENTLGYLKFDYQLSSNSSFQVTPYYHKNKGRGDWIPPYLVAAVDAEGNPVNEGGSIDSKYGFTDQNGTPLAPQENCNQSFTWPWNSGPGLHPACYSDSAVPVMSYRHTHYEKNRLGLTVDAQWTIAMNDIQFGLWAESNERKESRDWHKVVDARVYHHFDSTPYWTQYSNEFQTDTLKLYVQDTVDFGDLSINAGAQKYLVDIEKTDVFSGQKMGKVNSDSDLLFSIGGIYQLNANIELFAGYSENFAAIKDGVLERDASALEQIEPETAENIDLGLRYSNSNIDFSATYYTIDFENRITFIAPGSEADGIDYSIGTNGSYLNVGGIESDGFELSLNYRLNEQWNIYSSYTNNDSRYVGDAPGFAAGDKVTDSVDDMFVLSTDYSKGDFRVGASGKYTGERGDAPSYTVFDINAGYSVAFDSAAINSIDIAFVITNITDEKYLSTGTGNGTSFFIGSPRTASMTFTANF